MENPVTTSALMTGIWLMVEMPEFTFLEEEELPAGYRPGEVVL